MGSVGSTVTTTDDQANSPLFKLPGEIRNQIYRLVLVKNDHIIINSTGYDRSALLQTAKVLRSETLAIYYYENTFYTTVNHYDITATHKFATTTKNLLGNNEARVKLKGGYTGAIIDASWPNLLEWLRQFHANEVRTHAELPSSLLQRTKVPASSPSAYPLGALFQITLNLRHRPWTEVKQLVMDLRPTLIATDKQWAID